MKKFEFRDGIREVTDSLEAAFEELETYQLTYAEAKAKVNNKFLVDRLNKAQSDAINDHLARLRR